MELVAVGPLRVASVLWQPRAGAWVRTVAVKATYLLQPGESVLASEQEPLNEQDEHWNDDARRSVRAPCEIVPTKLRAEVMVSGHAFAPGGAPVRSLVARVIVGDVDKSIEVACDRAFTMEGALQEGARFTRMPLTYERAAGGPGTWNPVGVRAGARDAYGRQALPNLQPVGTFPRGPDEVITPVGFGPIAEDWPARHERLGRHAGTFGPGQWRDRPLPDGLDLGWFQQTPRDQQLLVLRDDERIVLENLHWEHARLVTSLPGVRPAVFVDQPPSPVSRLAMKADMMWIDTDRGIATLTWRGQIMLDRPDEAGRVVVGMEKQGQEIAWTDVERLAGPSRGGPRIQADPAASRVGGETLLGSVDRGPSLPFVRGAAPQRPADLPFQSPQAPAPPAAQVPLAAPTAPPAPMRVPPPAAPPVRAPQFGTPPPLAAPPMAVPPPISPPMAVPPPMSPPMAVPPPMSPPMAAPPPVAPPMAVPPPISPPAAMSPPLISSPLASPPAFAAPPRETVGMIAAAAAGGAMLSDAARDAAPAAAPWSGPKRDLRPSRPDAEPTKPSTTREFVQLLWFDPESAARIRLVERWQAALADLQERKIDRDLDEGRPGQDHGAAEDRREIFEILARGEITDASAVGDALADAIRDDGKMAPPIVLLSGEVELPFDEAEALGTAVATASPLITPGDEELKKAVAAAKDLAQTPGLAALPAAVEGMIGRVRDAFVREKKALPPEYFDAQVDRVLLSGRRHQQREVLGGTFLRCLLHSPALPGAEQAPALLGYLSAEASKKLPLFKRFRMRAIVEIHPAQDQFESSGEAVKILAIARIGVVPARESKS